MGCTNKALNSAKKAKNDEFYTRYEDIQKEVEQYYIADNNVFRDKVVLLPCDDYRHSQFARYFEDNFDRFGLKKLIISGISVNKEDKPICKIITRE